MSTPVVRYKCDYCKKTYSTTGNAKRHEIMCSGNPNNEHCRTCANFETFFDTKYVKSYDGNPGSSDYEVRMNNCAYFEIVFGEEFEFQHLCKGYKRADKSHW